MKASTFLLFGLWLVIAMTSLVSAQAIGDGVISGSGEVVLERSPDVMRMHIDLLAKGKDLPDAIAKLKSRRTKVEKQLESLGAAKESVKFGDLAIGEAQDDRSRQMEMMVMQRMAQKRGKGGAAKTAAVAKPITVSLKLKAEWPLKAGDTAEMLVASKKLQDNIKVADLGGTKDAAEPSPEEEELAEEMQEMAMNYGGQEGPKPGEPTFLFVAKIPAADREKALAEAFRAAKAQAAQLAKAADSELGALRSLQGGGGLDTDDWSGNPRFYNNPAYGALMRRGMNGQDHTGEAIGPHAGTVKYKVTVNAAFAVK